MRTYFTLAFISIAIISACAEKASPSAKNKLMEDLSSYQWKNRIILTFPSDEKAATAQQQSLLKADAEIKDRDLIILRVDQKIAGFSEQARLNLIKQHNLTAGSHVLIGKDGGVKNKQTGAINLKAFFNLIDQMPMRIREKNQ